MFFRKLVILICYGFVAFIGQKIIKPPTTRKIDKALRKYINEDNIYILLLLISIPEQFILYTYERHIGIMYRILVSLCMIFIRYSWGGKNALLLTNSSHEFVWILGTSFYAYKVIGVKLWSSLLLILIDTITTFTMRGFMFT